MESLRKEERLSSILGWKAHACARACKSTLAAQVMFALGGWEDAIAAWAKDVLQKSSRGNYYCGVPDRVAGPRRQKSALKHVANAEERQWSSRLPGAKALLWLLTRSQLADVLTKVKTYARSWWSSLISSSSCFCDQHQKTF